MLKEKHFYPIFCLICIIEVIIYAIYSKLLIKDDCAFGIKFGPSLFYGIIGYYFSVWLKFITFSYSNISNSLPALIFYFFTYFNIVIYSIATSFLYTRPFLFLGFICSLLIEIIYILYYYDYTMRKKIYTYNIKLGSNIKLKRALNVSKI